MSALITHAEVRMYRMGTGDCFVLKFFAGKEVKFKMMIDCGTWQGAREKLAGYVKHLKEYVGNSVDLLVVTHEHKDHVYGFEACRELFMKDFEVKQTWLGWTEKDGEENVEKWKQDYGQKKKALYQVATKLHQVVRSKDYRKQFEGESRGLNMLAGKKMFSRAVRGFRDLHFNPGIYTGNLAGMRVVKEIAKNNIRYCRPGDVIENVDNAEGLRFYVLGPPLSYEAVAKEGGTGGETFDHNKDLLGSRAFAAAVLDYEGPETANPVLPFDQSFVHKHKDGNALKTTYEQPGDEWRRIDFEWLQSAGTMALRMNSRTNNLSLALAIEFERSGRVMLFPGDAEFGSWENWHKIKWPVPSRNKKKHLTEELLNRTVFYKVAHHLSHNGTARALGVEMMKHKDLAAMATLDYSVISSGWMGTMPNRDLLRELITRTKGRLMVMQEAKVPYDKPKGVLLTDRIREEQAKMSPKELKDFQGAYVNNPLYLQYTVKANDAPANP